MSLLSAVKSFLGIHQVKDDSSKEKAVQSALSQTQDIGAKLAAGQVNTPDAHSGENGQPQNNLDKGDNYTKQETPELDVDTKKLAKKYKKNPSQALSDPQINRDFSTNIEEAEELKKLLKSKTDLRNYFELAKQTNLTNSDIVEGMKEIEKNKRKFLFIKWNKLDEEKFAQKINKFRGIRQKAEDLSSQAVAKISEIVAKKPELEDHASHFVAKRNIYTSENVQEAVVYMADNEKTAQQFFENTTKIENIRNEKNAIKYDGNSILHVSKGMTENVPLTDTIYQTALKKDMDNKNLVGITDNLIENPLMKDSYLEFLNLKDKEGNDRFSAGNLLNQTEFLTDKDLNSINKYKLDTMELASYAKMKGDDIVISAGAIYENPPSRAAVLEAAANENVSSELVSQAAETFAENSVSNSSTQSYSSTYEQSPISFVTSENTTQDTSQAHTPDANQIGPSNVQERVQKAAKVFSSENDVRYLYQAVKKTPELADVIKDLYRNPQIAADKIAPLIRKYSPQLLKVYLKDPLFFDKNPDLLKKYEKYPEFFERLKSYPSVTPDQEAQFAQYFNKKDLIFKMLDEKMSPSQVLTLLSNTLSGQKEYEIKNITMNNTISSVEKHKALTQPQDKKSDKALSLNLVS